MNAARRVKIDMNPKRVKNPYGHLKRSPGKFDQKVYMEQELHSSNAMRNLNKLYSMQHSAEAVRIDRAMIQIRRKYKNLKTQNEDYKYLVQLRDVLNSEKRKRDKLLPPILPLRDLASRMCLSPVVESSIVAGVQGETNNNTDNQAALVSGSPKDANTDSQTTATVEIKQEDTQPIVITNSPTDTQVVSKPPDKRPTKAAIDRKLKPLTETKQIYITDSQYEALSSLKQPKNETQKEATVELKCQGHPIVKTEVDHHQMEEFNEQKTPREDSLSPTQLAALERMSYDIMSCTLPVNKLKRIIPEQPKSVHEKWPILSNYRKGKMLPTVKQFKKRLSSDTSQLHARIHDYFGCEFPLSEYQVPKSAIPRKQKLLAAISKDYIKLPDIPKY